MTVTKAARRLFVSQKHVLSLPARGDLAEDLPRGSDGEPSVSTTSLETYLAAQRERFATFNEKQTEENDPLGL